MRTWESDFDIGTADVIRSAATQSYEASLVSKKRATSPKTGRMFRPFKADQRGTSTDTVHTVFIRNNYRLTNTQTDILKNSMISGIYHDHQQCSGHCECDPDVEPIDLQSNGMICGLVEGSRCPCEGIKVSWLPIYSTPQGLSPNEQATTVKPEYEAFTECVPNVRNKLPFQNAVDLVPDLDQNAAANCLDTPTLSQYVKLLPVPGICCDGQNHHRNQTNGVEFALSSKEGILGKGDCKESHQLVHKKPSFQKECPDFVDLRLGSDDVDETSNFTTDSVIDRRYIGSSFSPSNSLQCYPLPSPGSPVSVDIVVSKLEDIQLEEAEPVKTWAELGREFLDKYASGVELSPAERGRVAIREVFQRRHLTRSRSNKSEPSVGETPKIPSQRSFDHMSEWRRDRESSGDVTFDNVQEVVEYDCAREERLRAQSLPQSEREQFQDTNCYTSDPIDLNAEAEERTELGRGFYSSWVESELIRDQLFQTPNEPPAESATTPSGYGWRDWVGERLVRSLELDEGNGTLSVCFPAYPSSSLGSEDDGLEHHQGRNTNGKDKKTQNKSIKSDDTETAMATGFQFTQCAEQKEEILLETMGERTEPGQSERYHRARAASDLSDASSDISASTDRVTLDNYVACSLYGSVSAVKFANTCTTEPRRKELREGKMKDCEYVLSDNVSSSEARVDYASAEEDTFTAWNDNPTHSAELSRSANMSPLSTKLEMSKSSGQDFAIAGPYSDQKRTWMSNHRAVSPLVELTCLNALAKCSSAGPPSETDTEMSETFGHKLERYGHFVEDGSPHSTP